MAPDAGQILPIHVDYWQGEFTERQWIYLCRWMQGRGLVYTPDGWGWLAIILDTPPSGLALTPMGLTMNGRRQPNISIGNDNGPINIGGQQIMFSDVTLSGHDLHALIEALLDDAHTLPGPVASSARMAAESLQDAADGRLQESSPEVTGALAWVRERASVAVGSAGGSAMWAGTVAMARAFGWV